ncbi:nudix hydrolase 20, chloroplastic-like isoform X2 [Rutidosis leptorrhynchoides]|uniref:nudix hydrolase 20, chloroplastic-like isoform X2 n=1 Tax=Rutidosis leptorrhynchoides TaxID=125765 RepID=UPI003A98D041
MSIAASTITSGHHYHHHSHHQINTNLLNSSFPVMIPNRLKLAPLSITLNRNYVVPPISSTTNTTTNSIENSTTNFTWNDVFQISQLSSDLTGFFHKINSCNRGLERRGDFIPFVIEDHVVGYVHNGFVDHLSNFKDVFTCIKDNSYGSQSGHVTLQSGLKTPESRTEALGHVIKYLGERVIPGIRNELYPVTSSYGGKVYFSLERAAAPYFGIKAYGIHMNGYVEKDGKKHLWIAKRSETKPTYPGMLDHLVAGGLPHGITCEENVVKECEEEAGIPSSISRRNLSSELHQLVLFRTWTLMILDSREMFYSVTI